MAALQWDELARGLTGVAALLGMIIGVSHLMANETKPLIQAGLGMIAMSLGLLASV